MEIAVTNKRRRSEIDFENYSTRHLTSKRRKKSSKRGRRKSHKRYVSINSGSQGFSGFSSTDFRSSCFRAASSSHFVIEEEKKEKILERQVLSVDGLTCLQCDLTLSSVSHLHIHKIFCGNGKLFLPGKTALHPAHEIVLQEPNSGMLSCPWCPVLSCSMPMLQKHLSHCREAFKNKQAVHNDFPCPECFCKYGNMQEMLIHLQTHYLCDLKCTPCRKLFPSRASLLDHLSTCNNDKMHQCADCCRTFRDGKSFKAHVSNCNVNLQCLKCACTSLRRDLCFEHMEEHLKQEWVTMGFNVDNGCLQMSKNMMLQNSLDQATKGFGSSSNTVKSGLSRSKETKIPSIGKRSFKNCKSVMPTFIVTDDDPVIIDSDTSEDDIFIIESEDSTPCENEKQSIGEPTLFSNYDSIHENPFLSDTEPAANRRGKLPEPSSDFFTPAVSCATYDDTDDEFRLTVVNVEGGAKLFNWDECETGTEAATEEIEDNDIVEVIEIKSKNNNGIPRCHCNAVEFGCDSVKANTPAASKSSSVVEANCDSLSVATSTISKSISDIEVVHDSASVNTVTASKSSSENSKTSSTSECNINKGNAKKSRNARGTSNIKEKGKRIKRKTVINNPEVSNTSKLNSNNLNTFNNNDAAVEVVDIDNLTTNWSFGDDTSFATNNVAMEVTVGTDLPVCEEGSDNVSTQLQSVSDDVLLPNTVVDKVEKKKFSHLVEHTYALKSSLLGTNFIKHRKKPFASKQQFKDKPTKTEHVKETKKSEVKEKKKSEVKEKKKSEVKEKKKSEVKEKHKPKNDSKERMGHDNDQNDVNCEEPTIHMKRDTKKHKNGSTRNEITTSIKELIENTVEENMLTWPSSREHFSLRPCEMSDKTPSSKENMFCNTKHEMSHISKFGNFSNNSEFVSNAKGNLQAEGLYAKTSGVKGLHDGHTQDAESSLRSIRNENFHESVNVPTSVDNNLPAPNMLTKEGPTSDYKRNWESKILGKEETCCKNSNISLNFKPSATENELNLFLSSTQTATSVLTLPQTDQCHMTLPEVDKNHTMVSTKPATVPQTSLTASASPTASYKYLKQILACPTTAFASLVGHEQNLITPNCVSLESHEQQLKQSSSSVLPETHISMPLSKDSLSSTTKAESSVGLVQICPTSQISAIEPKAIGLKNGIAFRTSPLVVSSLQPSVQFARGGVRISLPVKATTAAHTPETSSLTRTPLPQVKTNPPRHLPAFILSRDGKLSALSDLPQPQILKLSTTAGLSRTATSVIVCDSSHANTSNPRTTSETVQKHFDSAVGSTGKLCATPLHLENSQLKNGKQPLYLVSANGRNYLTNNSVPDSRKVSLQSEIGLPGAIKIHPKNIKSGSVSKSSKLETERKYLYNKHFGSKIGSASFSAHVSRDGKVTPLLQSSPTVPIMTSNFDFSSSFCNPVKSTGKMSTVFLAGNMPPINTKYISSAVDGNTSIAATVGDQQEFGAVLGINLLTRDKVPEDDPFGAQSSGSSSASSQNRNELISSVVSKGKPEDAINSHLLSASKEIIKSSANVYNMEQNNGKMTSNVRNLEVKKTVVQKHLSCNKDVFVSDFAVSKGSCKPPEVPILSDSSSKEMILKKPAHIKNNLPCLPSVQQDKNKIINKSPKSNASCSFSLPNHENTHFNRNGGKHYLHTEISDQKSLSKLNERKPRKSMRDDVLEALRTTVPDIRKYNIVLMSSSSDEEEEQDVLNKAASPQLNSLSCQVPASLGFPQNDQENLNGLPRPLNTGHHSTKVKIGSNVCHIFDFNSEVGKECLRNKEVPRTAARSSTNEVPPVTGQITDGIKGMLDTCVSSDLLAPEGEGNNCTSKVTGTCDDIIKNSLKYMPFEIELAKTTPITAVKTTEKSQMCESSQVNFPLKPNTVKDFENLSETTLSACDSDMDNITCMEDNVSFCSDRSEDNSYDISYSVKSKKDSFGLTGLICSQLNQISIDDQCENIRNSNISSDISNPVSATDKNKLEEENRTQQYQDLQDFNLPNSITTCPTNSATSSPFESSASSSLTTKVCKAVLHGSHGNQLNTFPNTNEKLVVSLADPCDNDKNVGVNGGSGSQNYLSSDPSACTNNGNGSNLLDSEKNVTNKIENEANSLSTENGVFSISQFDKENTSSFTGCKLTSTLKLKDNEAAGIMPKVCRNLLLSNKSKRKLCLDGSSRCLFRRLMSQRNFLKRRRLGREGVKNECHKFECSCCGLLFQYEAQLNDHQCVLKVWSEMVNRQIEYEIFEKLNNEGHSIESGPFNIVAGAVTIKQKRINGACNESSKPFDLLEDDDLGDNCAPEHILPCISHKNATITDTDNLKVRSSSIENGYLVDNQINKVNVSGYQIEESKNTSRKNFLFSNKTKRLFSDISIFRHVMLKKNVLKRRRLGREGANKKTKCSRLKCVHCGHLFQHETQLKNHQCIVKFWSENVYRQTDIKTVDELVLEGSPTVVPMTDLTKDMTEKSVKRRQSKGFSCLDCNVVFCNFSRFKQHRVQVHDEDQRMVCHLCTKEFDHIQKLAVHYSRSHPTDVSPSLDFTKPASLKDLNLQRSSVNKKKSKRKRSALSATTGKKLKRQKYSCHGFSKQGQLKLHIQIHRISKKFKCPSCHSTSIYRNDSNVLLFNLHVKECKLNEAEPPASDCKTSCDLEALKENHMTSMCFVCHQNFDSQAGLCSHLYKKHGQRSRNRGRNKRDTFTEAESTALQAVEGEMKHLEESKASSHEALLPKSENNKQERSEVLNPPDGSLVPVKNYFLPAQQNSVSSDASCPECYKIFKSMTALSQHLRRQHGASEKAVCSICRRKFTHVKTLLHHHEIMHKGKDFKPQLESKLLDSDAFGESGASVVKDQSNVSDSASSARKSSPSVDLSQSGPSTCKEWDTKCSYCHKIFSDSVKFSNHLCSPRQGKPKFPCLLCGLVFKSGSVLSAHSHDCKGNVNVHKLSKSNMLPVIKVEKLDTQDAFNNHQSVDCNISNGEAMENISSSSTGSLGSVNPKAFTCVDCNLSYKIYSCLKRHRIHVHKEASKFTCSICAKGFSYPHTLKIHMQRRHRRSTLNKNFQSVVGSIDKVPKVSDQVCNVVQKVNEKKLLLDVKPEESPKESLNSLANAVEQELASSKYEQPCPIGFKQEIGVEEGEPIRVLPVSHEEKPGSKPSLLDLVTLTGYFDSFNTPSVVQPILGDCSPSVLCSEVSKAPNGIAGCLDNEKISVEDLGGNGIVHCSVCGVCFSSVAALQNHYSNH